MLFDSLPIAAPRSTLLCINQQRTNQKQAIEAIVNKTTLQRRVMHWPIGFQIDLPPANLGFFA